VGYAATPLADGTIVAAIAVANAFGDVVAADGTLLGSPHDEHGNPVRTAALVPDMPDLPEWRDVIPEQTGNTTLVCVCTDAWLDKRRCATLARMAGAGIARAVDPVFTPVDGDVVFCLSGPPARAEPPVSSGPQATWSLTVLGTLAATVTAAAVRDAVQVTIREGA
jgi:L-aminopeptidase/D-esterase-like protein